MLALVYFSRFLGEKMILKVRVAFFFRVLLFLLFEAANARENKPKRNYQPNSSTTKKKQVV